MAGTGAQAAAAADPLHKTFASWARLQGAGWVTWPVLGGLHRAYIAHINTLTRR